MMATPMHVRRDRSVAAVSTKRSDARADRIRALRLELAALAADVSALRRDVDALRRDREATDRAWLRALADAFGATPFTAVDVRRRRRIDRRLRACSTRELGARLRSLRDRPLEGFVLRFVTRSHGVRLWAVSVDADRHEDPSATPRTGAQ